MPLQPSYRHCLTMIDRFTRWPETQPLSNVFAERLALWTRWIFRFVSLKTITLEKETHLESAVFKHLANLVESKHIHTADYHP